MRLPLKFHGGTGSWMRPKGEAVEGLPVRAERDLALGAAVDEVEREPWKPLLREQPHVLHARCRLEPHSV